MKKKILVVSSANMDMVLNIESIPSEGQTVIEKGNYSYVPGGKGANSAVAFKRIGADCSFLTKLGNDSNADALLSLYKKEGIDTSFIERDNFVATGLATIFVEKNGQNRIIVFPGSNQKITKAQIDKAIEACPDALYMQFEINHDAILYSAKKAYEKNIPIFIDAGPADLSFPFDKMPPVEIFSPNETETLSFEIDIKDFACCKLLEMINAKYIVLKLGAKGAYVFNGKTGIIKTSMKIKAVDTTAAGDAFTAALTVKHLELNDIYKACEYANAVGALTVSRHGASSSIPTEKEIQAFLSK